MPIDRAEASVFSVVSAASLRANGQSPSRSGSCPHWVAKERQISMRDPNSNVAEAADVDRIISSLKEILAHDLNIGLETDQIDPDASLEADLKIDSVAMVELIS